MVEYRRELATVAAGRSAPRPLRVTGGKTPSEDMFPELPQGADIVGSPFHHLASPFVLQITGFWSEHFRLSADATMRRDYPE
jgi:hypothetical protein